MDTTMRDAAMNLQTSTEHGTTDTPADEPKVSDTPNSITQEPTGELLTTPKPTDASTQEPIEELATPKPIDESSPVENIEELATPKPIDESTPVEKVDNVKASDTPEVADREMADASSLLSFAASAHVPSPIDARPEQEVAPPSLSIAELFSTSVLSTEPLGWETEFAESGFYSVPLKQVLSVFSTDKLLYLSARNSPASALKKRVQPRFTVTFLGKKENLSAKQIVQAKAIKKDLARFYEGAFNGTIDNEKVPPRSPDRFLPTIDLPTSCSIVIRGKRHTGDESVVSGVTYTTISANQIMLLFAATTAESYDNQFGTGNDNLPFRRRGLMALLFHLVRTMVLSYRDETATTEIVLVAAVERNDPSRQFFFKKLGFLFLSASPKTLSQLFRESSPSHVKKLPVSGTEYFYHYRFVSTVNEFTEPDKTRQIPTLGQHSLGACGCGNPEHSAVYQHIRCLLCGDITHPDCCNHIKSHLILGLFHDAVSQHSKPNLLAATLQVNVPPTWKVCRSCSSRKKWLSGRMCAAASDDKSDTIAPTYMCYCMNYPVHAAFVCCMCTAPVHPTCCVFVRPSSDFVARPTQHHLERLPVCLNCAGHHQRYIPDYAIIRNWLTSSYPRQGTTFIEIPFPTSNEEHIVISQQVFKRDTASSVVTDLKGICTDYKDVPKRKRKNLMIRKDTWQANNNYKRDPHLALFPSSFIARLTTHDVRLLLLERSPKIFTPNTIEILISLINIPPTMLEKKRYPLATCLPMSLVSTVFSTFQNKGRAGIVDLCIKTKNMLKQFLFTSSIVLIPFLSPHLFNYGLAILRNRVDKIQTAQLFAIHYCQQDSFAESRSRYLIGELLRDYVDIAYQVCQCSKKNVDVNAILQSTECYLGSVGLVDIERGMKNEYTNMPLQFNLLTGTYLVHDIIGFLKEDTDYADQIVLWTAAKDTKISLFSPDLTGDEVAKVIVDFCNRLRVKFAPKYIPKLHTFMSNTDQWSTAQQCIKSANEVLRYCVKHRGNKGATDLDQAVFGAFLSRLLYCIGRDNYETAASCLETKHFPHVSNKCAMCQKSFVKNWEQTRDICLPPPSLFNAWAAMQTTTPAYIFKNSMIYLNNFIGVIDIGEDHFDSFEKYLLTKHPAIHAHYLRLHHTYEDMLYWDLVQVATILEVLIHDAHGDSGIEEHVQIWCTSFEALNDDKLHDKTVILSIDSDTTAVLVTCLEGMHHFLLELCLNTRQAIVMDGMDTLIPDAVRLGKDGRDQLITTDERGLVKYVDLVLDALNLHVFDDDKKLPVEFCTGVDAYRDGHLTLSDNTPWQVISNILADPDWDKYLIRQHNNHACGPVTLLQLLRWLDVNTSSLLDEDREINYASELCSSKLKKQVGCYIRDCLDVDDLKLESDWELELLQPVNSGGDGNPDPPKAADPPKRNDDDKQDEQDPVTPANSGSDKRTPAMLLEALKGLPQFKSGKINGPTDLDYPMSYGSRKRKYYETLDGTQLARIAAAGTDNNKLRKELEDALLSAVDNAQADESLLYSKGSDWGDFRVEIEDDNTDVESMGSDKKDAKMVEATQHWRFPSDEVINDDVNFNMSVLGIPNTVTVSFLEIADNFPFVLFIRERMERRSQVVSWEARLPGMGLNETSPLSKDVVDLIFAASFRQKMKQSRNQWLRVTYRDYDFAGIGQAEVDTNMTEQFIFDGGPADIVRLRHVRFSNSAWLEKHIKGTIGTSTKRYPGEPVTVMIPRNPYWFGEVYIPGKISTDDKYFAQRLSQRWVFEMFTDVLVSLVLQKSGTWIVVQQSEVIDFYKHLYSSDADDQMTSAERSMKKKEMALVEDKKRNLPEKDQAQVTHCLYRRNDKDRPDMATWVTRTMKLTQKDPYDFDKGWFFVLAADSPMSGEIAWFIWMRANFHKGFLHILMRNPGTWLRVPAGSKEKRTRGNKTATPDHDNESTAVPTKICVYEGKSYVQLSSSAPSWPLQKFKQGSTLSCVVTSMANALHYMGLTRTATMLQDQAKNSVKKQTNKEKTALIQAVLKKHEKSLFAEPPNTYGPGKFDPLENVASSPTMLILEAVDGDSHHAVTVYGHWIFDAAEDRAMPLCVEALNKCATPGFKRVLFAIRFNK